MRMQIAIADPDVRYLNTLVGFLDQNYGDVMEIVAFTKPDTLFRHLAENPKDVILLDETFGLSATEMYQKQYAQTVAYLVDENFPHLQDAPKIEKYKRADLIYEDIMALHKERSGRDPRDIAQQAAASNGKILLLTSFSGGVGVSTVAASLAKYLARLGEETLYLNLEPAGCGSVFFQGQGSYSFSDLLPALKDAGRDLSESLQSVIRRDADGVLFVAEPPRALDMAGLEAAGASRLLSALRQDSHYRYVVVDMNFQLREEMFSILDLADTVVLLSDGSMTANEKYIRTMDTLIEMEKQSHRDLRSRMLMLYNNFSSSKSSNEIPNPYIPVFGKFPPIKHATSVDIMRYLLDNRQDVFEKLR